MSTERQGRRTSNGSNNSSKAVVSSSKNGTPINTASNEDACVVCFKNVDIYSIGECDHPVCYECSTRMRVLCQQNECPICRQVLAKVVFTTKKLPYRELEAANRSEYYSRRYKISFYTNEIQQAFFELLDHPCPNCDVPPYRTFQGLRNHVRKEHDLIYCDLCVEHLKIFTFERRCYTHAELRTHLSKGDADNKSHRGHPLCEYCNKRYLDRDELFRHLRREHYFCHFCDADGCNEFYNDYDALAAHFRQDHYLCEEGRCATEQFVGAFRSEIDYKAHVSSVHGKSLNKQQAKQTRTLQLEITLGPRGRNGQADQSVSNMRTIRGAENTYTEDGEDADPIANQPSQTTAMPDASNEEDFPILAGVSASPNLSLVRPPPPTIRQRNVMSGLARTKENFPALSSNNGTAVTANQTANSATGATSRNNGVVTSGSSRTINNASAGMVVHLSNRPPKQQKQQQQQQQQIAKKGANAATLNDFPSLLSTTNSKSKAKPPQQHHHIEQQQQQHRQQQPQQQHNQQQHQQQNHHHQQQQQQHRQNHQPSALDEDMFPPMPSTVPLNNVAAKHRALVDDYVSVASPINFQKLQLVQRQEEEMQARKAKEKKQAPKLTSQDFPTLSGQNESSATNAAQTWVKINTAAAEKKQRELENRKAKIATAPVLPTTKIKPTLNATPNKKDKRKNADAGVARDGSKEQNNNNKNEQNKLHNNNYEQLCMQSDDDASAKNVPRSSVTLNSVAKLPNNLTFTSSLGESYSIVPSSYGFSPPPDAPTRNQNLMMQFKQCLKTKEALENFRRMSQMFRDGSMSALAYYEHCQSALENKFDNVFPELLALLPDISKQQALYLVHSQRLNEKPSKSAKAIDNVLVCKVCKQVVKLTDFDNHEIQHNFPSLSGKSSRRTNK